MNRIARCKRCGGRNFEATGSTQERKDQRSSVYRAVSGQRVFADIRCTDCGKTRWSCHPTALKMAREVDKAKSNAS